MKTQTRFLLADLHARHDKIDEDIARVDGELRKLVEERKSLVEQAGHVAAGINAIALAAEPS